MKKTTKTTKTKALTPANMTKKAAPTPATKPRKTTPAVKKTAPAPVVTKITAHIDVGFGNTLYLRGEGPGLSWERGIPMDCTADDQWTCSIAESVGPVTFKFLLNDETWCAGDDFTLAPGSSGTFKPEF